MAIIVAFLGIVASQAATVPRRAAAPPADGAAVTATFTATGPVSEERSVEVVSDRDADGDGALDTGVLRYRCNDGRMVHAVIAPRDTASGMATGKRAVPLSMTATYGPRATVAGATEMALGGITAMDDWCER